MSGGTLKADSYANSAGTGAPDFPFGFTTNGFSIPTIQKFLSGSGTYTTPVGVKYLEVEMVGPGGGGGGSSSLAASDGTNGGTGADTTFGTSLLIAGAGQGGHATDGTLLTNFSAHGGPVTLNSPAYGTDIAGSDGGNVCVLGSIPGGGANGFSAGGNGGSSALGGAAALASTISAGNGGNAKANSGSGGGGGNGSPPTTTVASLGGFGGGAGGYIRAIVPSPASSYSFVVGSGGSGGAGGTSGNGGGNGGSGIIIVREYYV